MWASRTLAFGSGDIQRRASLARVSSAPNPTDGIKMFWEEKRERFLNPDEMKRLHDALLEESNEE